MRHTVVGHLDPDVPVQASGNDARDERKNISDGLPSVLAHTLVRQRKSVLPLVAVDEQTYIAERYQRSGPGCRVRDTVEWKSAYRKAGKR
jgi:hypothetical protein